MPKHRLLLEVLEGRVLAAAQVTRVILPPAPHGSYRVLHENQGVEVSPITPGLVATNFVKGFQITGIGKVSAAPVYIPHVATNGGFHDIWVVATQDANLYKYDAHTGRLLGGVNLDYAAPGSGLAVNPVDGAAVGNSAFKGNFSITGTPAVRPDGKIVLLLEKVVQGFGATHHDWDFLVVNPSTLLPTVVNTFADTTVQADGSVSFLGPTVPGTGGGSFATPGGPQVPFDARAQYSRPAIQLDPTGLVATVGFGSYSGAQMDQYHGYLLSFNTNNGALVGSFNATPSGVAGSEWGSGLPVTLDLIDPFTVYATWGNGTTGYDNYADTVTGLRLEGPLVTPNGVNERMTVLMVPPNHEELAAKDLDEGSTQVTLVSPTEGISSGKSGNMFLFNTRTGKIDQTIVNGLNGGEFGAGTVLNTTAGTFVYFVNAGFNGQTTFAQGAGRLLVYKYDPVANRLALAGVNTTYTFNYPGATPTVSVPRDGNFANAVVWVSARTSRGLFLAAFRADNLQLIREFPAPGYSHFMPPVINGFGQVAVNAEDNGGGFAIWGPSTSFTGPARASVKAASTAASLPVGAATPLSSVAPAVAKRTDSPQPVKLQGARNRPALRVNQVISGR